MEQKPSTRSVLKEPCKHHKIAYPISYEQEVELQNIKNITDIRICKFCGYLIIRTKNNAKGI